MTAAETPDTPDAERPAEPAEPGAPAEPACSAAPGAPAAPAGLSERDRAVLAVERRGWPGPGAKERAIRERLGLSPTRYYQLLGALLDDPRAAEHDPVTVNRLRRVRDARRARR
ncbi:DUF3263 domain-containing protein [Streptomyces corynorhini]|uniref:DUF3263 domain-containing protein n=1 Tax=Streptomyces corynorhini TaxID=2282652 RepID=A0A370B9W9_9ACTN|nr:DUF3263 domain-containing protein [Streptomyces corynorhini]RDG38580.1 DUF3263 domain-containing protein [Streptomyces corynorhini]